MIPTRAILANAFVCLALSILVHRAFGLDPTKSITQYQQDIWTERDGLPQGTVQAITQTRDGYLWLGTRDGLARFDGVSFTAFRAETTSGLRANDIRALRQDRQGQLWIGTFNGGLSCYSQRTFRSYNKDDGFPASGVLDIFEDRNGNLWFGTWDGVARLDSGKFRRYGVAEGLLGQSASSFCQDSRGQLWVATEAALNQQIGDGFAPAPKQGRWPRGPLREVYATRDGSLWVTTASEGLFQLHNGKGTYYTEQDGLPDNKIRTVLQDRHGSLWIGTASGLCRFQNGTFASLTSRDGLPHDSIESLYEDWEGSLWIGTRGGGLARLRDGKFFAYTTKEGLAQNFTKCVLQSRDGALWIGTHGGALSRLQNGHFTHFTTKDGLLSQFVWALEQDRDGNIWVGTGHPSGLHLYKDGKFVAYGTKEGLPMRRGIRAITAGRDGGLWIGGDGGGLCRFQGGVFKCLTTKDGLRSNLIRVIYEDRAGDIWVGTNDGLCCYHDGQFTCYTVEQGLAHNAIYAIFEDSSGNLWLGTQGGLSRYASGRFHSYTSRDGLVQNVIYQILEDQGNLWMSSNRGVFCVSKQALLDFDEGKVHPLPCVSYGVADGMRASQCEGGNQPAGCKDKDGRLWFPTAHGVAVIDPAHLSRNLQPPPVFVEQVRVGKEELNPLSLAKLSPGTREFTFQYTALSFTAPEKIRFKYRLEGLDEKWVDAQNRRVAFYNEIPPGDYRFHVVACNSDGMWNDAGAVFAFSLAPHLYQRAWFFALCGLGTIFAGWSFHRHRMNEARRQFSIVLTERNRIARDLHDTLAQGFAGLGFQLEAVATKLIDAPHQAKEHLNMALQMVRHSLAEARRSVLNLRSSALETGGLEKALAETARQMMADKPIQIQSETSGQVRPLPSKIENELLRIGQEAITNSFKYAHANTICIELNYRPSNIRLRIRDNGQGFETSEEAEDGRTHFGLLGMRERAKKMGAKLSIQSEPGHGTEVLVDVPLPACA